MEEDKDFNILATGEEEERDNSERQSDDRSRSGKRKMGRNKKFNEWKSMWKRNIADITLTASYT